MLFQNTAAAVISRSITSPTAQFLLDWMSFVVPVALSALGESALLRQALLLSLIAFSMLAIISQHASIRIDRHVDDRLALSLNTARDKRFLIWFRSSMMIGTVVAILAIDFPLFPRMYAKVETWGISLMDVGVGCFVVSSALVSQRVRDSTQTTYGLAGSTKAMSWFGQISATLKGVSVAAALGVRYPFSCRPVLDPLSSF